MKSVKRTLIFKNAELLLSIWISKI
jgi:hypothetical protein